MPLLMDAFWRAAAYCLHPRMVLWSLAPLLVTAGLAAALGWWAWEDAINAVRAALEAWSLGAAALAWLDGIGAGSFKMMIAPLLVLALAVPLVVVVSLLMVAFLMAPAVVRLVARRRFAALERRGGGGLLASVLWALGSTLIALLALLLSMPFWLIPPLVLVLPPLIWGWLGYRVMAYDALAEHADAAERRQLLARHRGPLLTIGVVTGYLGAAPSLLWALGAATLVLAPVLLVLSVWLYTLVFAFSCLWFTHYALAALETMRREAAAAAQRPPPAPPGGEVFDVPTYLLPPSPPPAAPPALPRA